MEKNKKVLFLLLGVIALFFSVQPECESQSRRARRDGLWWQELNPQLKKEIVIGYYNGAILGFTLVREKITKDDPCQVDLSKASRKIETSLLEIDPFQIVAVADSIYGVDTLNLGLMIYHTIWLASNCITVKEESRIRKIYDSFRKEDCFKFKSIQELRNYQQPY
jgi:hypothetical protein